MASYAGRMAAQRGLTMSLQAPRRIVGIDGLVIACLLAVAGMIAYYVHHGVSQVRQLLPGEVLQQQHDISVLVHALDDLAHSLELAGHTLSPAIVERSRRELAHTGTTLDGMRRDYTFDSLTGASGAHAMVNPAVEDIQRWLAEGLPGYPPDSPVVLRLAHTRAREVYDAMRSLEVDNSRQSAALMHAEAERLDGLRSSLMTLVLAFAALTLGIVVLYIRQRNTRARYAIEHRRLSDAMESAGAAVALFDGEQRLVMCNRQYRNLNGLSIDGVQSRLSLADILGRAIGSGRLVQIDEAAEGLEEEYRLRRQHPGQPFMAQWSDGRYFQVCEYTTGEGGTICVLTDITDLKRAQRRLEHLATHDALTGLPSRRRFEAAMQAAVHRAGRHGRQLAVMFVDVDRFKWVNDTYGHMAGDRFLKTLSQRLRTALRDHDPAARIGGDEFAVILEDVTGRDEVASTAARILDVLAAPVDLDSGSAQTTVSIGVAMYPADGDDGAALIKRADDACYQAKAGGRAGVRFFTDGEDRAAARRSAIEHRLRLALQHDALQVYYQPQVDMDTRRTIGLEALLRWEDDTLGWVCPSEFIPIAEDSGLGRPLLRHTAFEVCRQLSEWGARGMRPGRTWLNVSPRQLHDVSATLASAFEHYDLDPMLVGIEITERTLVDDPEHARSVLNGLKEQGISLAIDDFGVGYSSLSALRDYPLDELKIDASFVQHLCDAEHDVEIVRAIVAMARSLRLRVVAEGVETEAQLQVLEAERVLTVQGNLTGAPAPAHLVERYLHPDGDAARMRGGLDRGIGMD